MRGGPVCPPWAGGGPRNRAATQGHPYKSIPRTSLIFSRQVEEAGRRGPSLIRGIERGTTDWERANFDVCKPYPFGQFCAILLS